ncbi:MAG: hypothetical protein IGR80_12580 [Synechococcales cyanobacterium K44_A2020_017]|nr:hypothetical protein [Synechococcales cyanobacterium K32_A2020_035]MBF2095580.1 hypothetical protein [Synechococcales cyanobacterium K44_A2020_017]
MLKLTYSDMGLYLERVAEPLEVLLARRALLALRTGHSMHIHSSRASLLFSTQAIQRTDLEQAIQAEWTNSCRHFSQDSVITLEAVDEHWIEVSLPGVWIASDRHTHDGIVMTCLGDRLEALFMQLWRMQNSVSFCSES